MELTKLSKTDKTAKELLAQLKAATTEEEKEKAKQNGKEYIQAQTAVQQTEPTSIPTEDPTPANPDDTDPIPDTQDLEEDKDSDIPGDPEPDAVVPEKVIEKKYDMSEPAFNPRLAKMGITREEELFKLGVYVRKLTRQEKIEIRRSIYQKKKKYMSGTQERFKKEQAEKKAALEADPEYQKYKHQQRFVIRIVEALKNHCNIDWMLKNIEGLTVDVVRELLQKPENVNKFRQEKEEFVTNFYKRFGKDLTTEDQTI